MSISSPDTVQEWAVYVKSTPIEEAWGNLKTINRGRFITTLKADGFDPEEIDGIIYFFAKRVQESGTALPKGGAYKLDDHLRRLEKGSDPCVAIYAGAEGVASLPPEPDEDDRRSLTTTLIETYPL